MKKIKKVFSVLLAVTLLFSSIPSSAFAVANVEETTQQNVVLSNGLADDGSFAEEDRKIFGEIKIGTEITVEESGYYSFKPEESDVYSLFSSNRENTDPVAELYDADFKKLTDDDDGAGNLNFELCHSFEAGKTYYLYADYYSEKGRYTLNVKKSDILSIEYISGGRLEYIKEDLATGFWRTEYNGKPLSERYFEYTAGFSEYDQNPPDIKIRVNYKNGFSEEIGFFDENGDNTGVSFDSDQYHNPWTVGGQNEANVVYKGLRDSYFVDVVESPIKSAKVKSGGKFEFIEYDEYNGRWSEYRYDEKVDKYFTYDEYRVVSDMVLEVEYNDGTTKVVEFETCEEDGSWNRNIFYYCDQYINPWTVGGNNNIELNYKGFAINHSVTVKESPVESIKIISGGNFEYFENSDDCGHFNEYEGFFYYYDYLAVNDIVIEVKYKNGETKQIAYAEQMGEEQSSYITYSSNQYENPWTVGGENKIVISYMGKNTSFSAKVYNPVASITVDDIVLTEFTNGWYVVHSNQYGEFRYWEYNLYHQNINVVMTNGDSYSGTVDELEEQTGYRVSYSSNQSYDNQWGVGEHTATVSFMGKKCEFTVTIEEGPVESIFVKDITCFEKSNGWWNSGYTWDEETQQDVPYKWFEYQVYPTEIIVNYKNGDSITGTPDEINMQTGCWPDTYSGQSYENQWGVGEHTATLSFMGKKCEFTVTIEETPVESVVVEDITYFEKTNGCWNNEYVWDEEIQQDVAYKWYQYSVSLYDGITINYKNGESITGTSDEIYEQTGYWLEVYSDQAYNNQWGVGQHTATISFMGKEFDFTVTIEETPVESIVVEDITYFEKTNGCWSDHYIWDEETQQDVPYEWYEYRVSPNEITINYKNGESITGTPDEIYEQTGYWLEVYSDQAYENQWGVGENTATVFFMGKECEFTVTIEESPVESIVVEEITCFENTNGCWNNGEIWDEETQQYIPYEWFEYSVYPNKITVNYKNGESITGTPDEIYEQTGYSFDTYSGQSYENQWGVGEHTATISFMGKEFDFTVIIEESPIESIVVDDITCFEKTNGWWNYGEFWDEETQQYVPYEWFEYQVFPNKFSINYKNGESITGTRDEIYEQTGYWLEVYSYQSYENQWSVGENTAKLSFMGKEFDFTITIEETPVESIVVGDITCFDKTDGWWNYGEFWDEETQQYVPYEWFEYSVYPKKITVNYKNGDSITGTPDEIYEQTGYSLDTYSGQSYYNQWTVGKNDAKILFMGFETTFIVEVVQEVTDGEFKYFVNSDNQVIITDYIGSEQVVEFPSEISGCPVKQIGFNYSFNYNESITEIIIPNGVEKIVDGAFSLWYSVNSITIPASVSSIGYQSLPNGHCLNSIILDKDNQNYLIDEYGVLYNIDKTVLIRCPIIYDKTDYVIPNTVTKICESAFYGCEFSEITIPLTVKTIGYQAFQYCYNIENVYYMGSLVDKSKIEIGDCNDYLIFANWDYAIEHEHTYDDVCDEECNDCGFIRDDAHSYDDNCDTDCNVCGTTREIIHLPNDDDGDCTTDITCSVCGEVVEEGLLSHSFTDNCDTDCDNFGCTHTREITHIPNKDDGDCTTEITCSVCGAVTTEAKSEHIFDNNCDADCNECDFVRTITHTYDNDCDRVCNLCGNIRTVPDHVYDDDKDAFCNICGFERQIISKVDSQIVLENASVAKGNEVTVNLKVVNNEGFAALNLGFIFDSEYITIKEVNNLLPGFTLTSDLSFVWDSLTEFSSDDTIATVTFEVNENAPDGVYDIQVMILSASDENGESVEFVGVAGKLEVFTSVYGDANGDNIVNTQDLVMLRKYLASVDPITGETDIEIQPGADVNGDKIIDTVDIMILRKYLASIDPVTGESSIVLGPNN